MIKSNLKKGSILIWTVMLGVLMTTVFFYAAIRFSKLQEQQQETIEYKNTKAFFDSFMDYLKENPSEMVVNKTSDNYEGIDITLTQNVSTITGALDSLASATYEDIISAPADLKIEYNLCENGLQTEHANIKSIPDYTIGPATQPCASFDYANYVMIPVIDDLELSSLDAPFHYKISGADMKDSKWHLSADMKFGFGKRLRENIEF
ncbi:hypothetical protein JW758_01230 [Candidatus Peregrinibacteria bacterium]|nr:hypothetical protein [Candidatus Peregrinibacteria bacterium]